MGSSGRTVRARQILELFTMAVFYIIKEIIHIGVKRLFKPTAIGCSTSIVDSPTGSESV